MLDARSHERRSDPGGGRDEAGAQAAAGPVEQVLALQEKIGNAAVGRVLSRQHGAVAGARAGAHAGSPVGFEEFLTTGTALNGQQLGPKRLLAYYMYGVEVRFALNSARSQYRNLRPRQYSGPEAVWIKRGQPLAAPWTNLSRSEGTGWDDPEPQSITNQPGRIAYYDSPGPNLGPMVASAEGRPSRVHVVQNFTGWVEGIPPGGRRPERLCPVVAWYSKIHLGDQNWDDHSQPPSYVFLGGTGAGQGWRPTDPPPV